MRFLTICATILFAFSISAQHQMSFGETIATIEQSSNIKFAYDPQIIDQVELKFADDISLQAFISITEKYSNLKITSEGENYFSIVLPTINYAINLTDSLSGLEVELPTLALDGIICPLTKMDSGWSFNMTADPQKVLTVHAFGFDDQVISFRQLITQQNLRIFMHPKILELSGITISDYLTKGIDMDPMNQSINIKTDDLPLLPGETDGDIFASLAALPGIYTPDSRPGNLFIRGSSTDQTLILYNNIPIYHRGHYFGTISPYNPKIVNSVKVYRNGFNPSIGGRVGGAIQIDTEVPTSSESNYGVGINTMYGMGYFKLPSQNNKWSISFSARRSFPYSWGSPKLKAISDMVFAATALTDTIGKGLSTLDVLFEDYSAGVTYQPNSENSFSATLINTKSSIAYQNIGETEQNILTNAGANFEWKRKVSKKLKSDFSVTLSDYDFTYESTATERAGAPKSINTISDVSIQEELKHTLAIGKNLTYGVDYTRQNVFFDYADKLMADTSIVQKSIEQTAHTFSPFVNYEWSSRPKIYLQAGCRGNYYDKLKDFRVSPRLFFNYYPNEHFTLKLSSGLYYQYLSQVKVLEFINGGFDNELWLMADGNDAKILEGQQSMLGAIFQKNEWIIDVEGYYKQSNNVNYYSQGRFSERGYFFQGDHEMYGIDVMIKKAFTDHLSSWIGYSWGESVVKVDTSLKALQNVNSQYSQPHRFYLGASWQKGNFKSSAGWRYSSSQYSRTFRIIEANNNFLIQRRNSPPGTFPNNPFAGLDERYPNVHQLDVSASYTLPKSESRDWKATFGISILNLYDQTNTIDNVVRSVSGNPVLFTRYGLHFAPNAMICVEW